MTYRPYAGKIRIGNTNTFLDISDIPDGYVLGRVGDEIIATSVTQGQLSLDEPMRDSDAATKLYVDIVDTALQGQIDNIVSNVDPAALDSLTEIVTAFQSADENLNGAITDLATDLQAAIDAEEAARIAADGYLQSDIEAEAAARESADSALQSDIDAEVARATAADTTLQGNIDSEVSARSAADTTLQGNIDSEASARSAADTTLQGNIDSEASARESADTTLQGNIDSEVSARSAADTTLQGNIDSETSARESADTTLQGNIDSEASARSAADTTLQGNIDSEASARSAADTTLQGNIDSEASARLAGDESLQAAIDDGYTSLLAEINALEAYIDDTEGYALDVRSDLDQEIIDRAAGDAGLQAGLSSESTARSAADATLQSNINSEASARESADTTLQGNIDSEVSARSAADTTLQGNIDSEASARSAADTTLQGNIDSEVSARSAADTTLQGNIDSEASARSAADTTLQGNIDSEASARSAADAALQNQIDFIVSNADGYALDSLTEIVAAFQGADSDLNNAITSLASTEAAAREAADDALQANIDAEAALRLAADNALQSDIDEEIADRIAGDSALQTAVDAEEAARISGDGYLQSQIDAEVVARDAGDAALQSAVDAEQSARIAADSSLQSAIDDGYSSLLAEINALEAYLDDTEGYALDVRSDLDQEIIDRAAADTTLQGNIDSEASARSAADTTLQGNIDSEASARSAADTTLQGNIDSEASARSAADTTLQGNIDSEASARSAADTTLQGNIDSEVSARSAADTTLQGNIDSEASARSAADTTLQGNIDSEASARSAADTALQSAIDAEETRAIAAEDALDARVDALEATPRVQVYDDLASFPASGTEEVVYIAADTNDMYRWESITLPESYDVTVGATGDFATLEAALASASVQDGYSIFVQAGVYNVTSTININKQVKIYGAGIGNAVLQTAGTTSDPVSMINVSVDNVLLKGLTIKHRKSNNTSVETAVSVSGPGFPQTRVSGFIMDACRVEHVEFAVTVRGSGWKLANSEFAYEGPTNSTRRHVGVYGVSGNCFVVNNTSSNNASSGSLRWIQITSTTGTNPNETLVGKLVVQNNSQTTGALAQFISQDAWQGTAGSFELLVKNNTTNETSAFVSFYGSAANFGDILSAVTVSGNSLSNTHGGANNGGKGVIGVDGTGPSIAFRSSALVVHASSNTLANSTYRTDYSAVDGTTVGRNTAAIASFSVSADTSIPANPSEPATPSAGGGTSEQYVDLSVADLSLKLDLAGGTMSGAIAMGSNKITGLADGTNANDAVNLAQLQAAITAIDPAGDTGQIQFNLNESELGASANLAWDNAGNVLSVTGGIQAMGVNGKISVYDTLNTTEWFVADAIHETLSLYTTVSAAQATLDAANVNVSDDGYTAQLSVDSGIGYARLDLYVPAGSSAVPYIKAAETATDTPVALKLDASEIDVNGSKVVNVADPTADQDAATKKYVDDLFMVGVREVTSSETLTADDELVLINGAGALTITLPTAVGNSGRKLIIKKMDSNAEDTIEGNGSELIDGDSSVQIYLQYEALTLVSNGSRWLIV